MNKKNQIKIYDFTKREIDYFRENCNLSPPERELFELRNQYYTLEQAAEKMNISSKTAYRLNKKIKQKIVKVCMQMYSDK